MSPANRARLRLASFAGLKGGGGEFNCRSCDPGDKWTSRADAGRKGVRLLRNADFGGQAGQLLIT